MNNRISSREYNALMTNEKITFVIPGYKHNPRHKAYKAISKILKTEGYFPILANIPWKGTTISENTQYFLEKYQESMLLRNKAVKKSKTYVLGFSYGAMIAFLISTKLRVSGLILCSLSPYFKEDLRKFTRKDIALLTPRRYEDFSHLHSATLAKQTKAKHILMLYGEKEAKPLINRVKMTYRNFQSKSKYLISINNTEHTIGSKPYLQEIHHAAKILH
ncbi:MAG TPA: hypothetical protein VLG12_00335 [Candidatus Saccharimonadales bacterium]|nr:hypothetical protein [Candidatus Saccharimonadales bacterium]